VRGVAGTTQNGAFSLGKIRGKLQSLAREFFVECPRHDQGRDGDVAHDVTQELLRTRSGELQGTGETAGSIAIPRVNLVGVVRYAREKRLRQPLVHEGGDADDLNAPRELFVATTTVPALDVVANTSGTAEKYQTTYELGMCEGDMEGHARAKGVSPQEHRSWSDGRGD